LLQKNEARFSRRGHSICNTRHVRVTAKSIFPLIVGENPENLKVIMHSSDSFFFALKILCTLAAVCISATAVATELAPLAAPEYRLRLDAADAFRLPHKELNAATNPRRDPATSAQLAGRPFAKQIEEAARAVALDPALVHAVIDVESGYNPAARSNKGALGLMQVMPETASRYGVNDVARSPEANLKAGTLYLRDLMELFDNRIELVLAAYNAGENAVLRHGQSIPPYRETQLYVPAVLAKYRAWQEPLPAAVSIPTRINYMPGTTLNPAALGTSDNR
jgi:soluble lytic murein transglycosylase-like protein